MMHSDSELITRLAAELARQMRPPIPVEIDLWDIARIGVPEAQRVGRARADGLPAGLPEGDPTAVNEDSARPSAVSS
jgi:hypothetical protein